MSFSFSLSISIERLEIKRYVNRLETEKMEEKVTIKD